MTIAAVALRRMLADLGAQGRTGALYVGGRPGGVFYLVDGRIAYAESPASPGLGERLVSCGRIAAATWAGVLAEGRDDRCVGRLLLRDGLIGENELATRVVATITDAMLEILQSDDGPMRFVPNVGHWLGTTGVLAHATAHATAERLRARPGPDRPRRGGNELSRTRVTRSFVAG